MMLFNRLVKIMNKYINISLIVHVRVNNFINFSELIAI